jgi:hypothetical protein
LAEAIVLAIGAVVAIPIAALWLHCEYGWF